MPKRLGWVRVFRALAGLSLGLAGCQSPGWQRIVGPDGSPMAHVHCGSEQGLCFRMAGELCPLGYDIRPVLSGNDGNFLVRCHGPSAPTVVASGPPPTSAHPALAPSPADHASAPKNDWPPAAEPSPAQYPWPTPAPSAAVSAQPSLPAAQGELDLGY